MKEPPAQNIAPWRLTLQQRLTSSRFHIILLFLIVLDCIFVFIIMLIDLKLFDPEVQNHHPDPHNSINGTGSNSTSGNNTHTEMDHKQEYNAAVIHQIEHLLHYASMGLLIIFLIEIILKMIAFGMQFFKQIEEVVDGIIVFVSLVLDIVFTEKESIKYADLIIALRLWRLIRICHAMVLAARAPLQHKLEKSERHQDMIETELREAKAEIIQLRHKLKVNQSDLYVSIEDLSATEDRSSQPVISSSDDQTTDKSTDTPGKSDRNSASTSTTITCQIESDSTS